MFLRKKIKDFQHQKRPRFSVSLALMYEITLGYILSQLLKWLALTINTYDVMGKGFKDHFLITHNF